MGCVVEKRLLNKEQDWLYDDVMANIKSDLLECQSVLSDKSKMRNLSEVSGVLRKLESCCEKLTRTIDLENNLQSLHDALHSSGD